MHRFEARLPRVGIMRDRGFVPYGLSGCLCAKNSIYRLDFLLKVRQWPLFGLHGNGRLQGRQEDLVFQKLATGNNTGKASATIDGLEDSLST